MSFTCPRCGTTSGHPVDEQQGYCVRCHDWTAVGADGIDRTLHGEEREIYEQHMHRLRSLNAGTGFQFPGEARGA